MQREHLPAPETARLTGLSRPALALGALMLIAAAFYFPWRLSTLNPAAPILSGVVYGAELFGLFCLGLHFFMTSKLTVRTPLAPIEGVTVDVFVTTYDEPVSMLRRTLAAAKQMRRATRIVLLDDGNRASMRKLAEELGVDYLARTDNTHAKAGNLNHGLEHSKADFVATFDADHAPAPDFLEQTLGYFRNEHVAVVQTPQDFYNLDSFQHRRFGKTNRFWTEQSLFFRVIQPGKDRWNAAFFCGSCAVLRRWSLNRIGGFATGTITEDLHTSIKLHKAGFESVYHNASLAFGVAPASYEPYQTQRLRWGQGAMQVWRKEGIVFARGLTLVQRLCYLASIITYFDAWQKMMFYLLPPFVLITGIMPMAHIGWDFPLRFLPWFVLSTLVGEEFGRGYARAWTIEQYNFLRAPAFLRATLALFTPNNLRFKVTRKTTSNGAAHGQLARMAIFPALCLLAIPIGIWRVATGSHLPEGAFFANVAWSLLLAGIMIAALRFAWSRTGDKRLDYRFIAPLPFDVHLPSGGWGTLRALDMTPEGVRLAAPMGLDLSVGQKLDAVLRLPGGNAPVTLRIRHRVTVIDDPLPQRMEIGCAVAWRSAADQDRLNALLFGAGLEQHLLELTEQGASPLDRFANDNKPEPREMRRAWAPGSVESGGHVFDVAAQPLDNSFGEWRVLSYEPMPQNATMRLPTRGANGETGAPVRVMSAYAIPAGASAVHVSIIELITRPPARPTSTAGGDAWLLAGAAAAMLAIAGIGLGATATARAATLAIAGAEGGVNSSYAFAGVVAPLPGQDEHNGWAVRATTDRLTYSYDHGANQIDARAYGGEVAVVRRWSGSWGWADASVGVRARTTKLTPKDAANPAEGNHTDVAVQVQGRAAISKRDDVTWLASHALDQQDTMARVGVDHDVGGMRLGVDITHLSGRSYGENQAGVTAQWQTHNNATISARAGASRNEDGEGGGYAGLGLAINLH